VRGQLLCSSSCSCPTGEYQFLLFFSSVVLIFGVNSASQVTVRPSQRSFKHTPFLVSLDGDQQLFNSAPVLIDTLLPAVTARSINKKHHNDPTSLQTHHISRAEQTFTNIISASTYCHNTLQKQFHSATYTR